MSPPIRDGSGNSIGSIRLGDGSEIAEVRTGAGDVLFSALPDSVTSRPNDDTTATISLSTGLVVNFASDFNKFAVRISSSSSGFERLRLYDYGSASYIYSDNISNNVAGDIIVVNQSVDSGIDYGVEMDANGSTYTLGNFNSRGAYPFTGTDVDIVARSDSGTQVASGGGSEPQAFNDIGNPGSVL
ncbi:hypothetical protein 7778G3F11_33 [Haloquadratum phage sp.]|nr:hypothetical protein 7778G3F11_33 [Haloquadratum phage sp.]